MPACYKINYEKIVKACLAFLLIFLFSTPFILAQGKPISLHPVNPHYFNYKEKPAMLITSGEHYGSVINLDFDYLAYLDELQSKGLNLTRIFTGVYLEPMGAFNISKNTLAPATGRFICPWPGFITKENEKEKIKYDLTKWDTAYFNRLRNFIKEANTRGVVIELTLFCPFYDETQWILSPLNSINNINGAGSVIRTDVYTLDKSGGLLRIQEELVRKIVNELKDFDNLIYEICNEPYFGGVTLEWQHHIADIIEEAEKSFTFRHLISQNIANGSLKIINPHPAVSIFNFHYAAPPHAVAQNYALNKVIGDNETGFDGNSDSAYRREAWEFLLAGGGLYNNLDYSFTAGNENGNYNYPSTQPGGGSAALRRQLGFLKKFLYRFDFIRMHPDSTLIKKGLPLKMIPYALTEPGMQYAFYFFSPVGKQIEIKLPAGTYELEWMNPLTGIYSKKKRLKHSEEIAVISVPAYKDDMVLRIVRSGKRINK